MIRAALAFAALAVTAAVATAGTYRIAIVVGNNAGNGDRPPLHYAETDAAKLADVLVELGGVAHDDLALLQGKDLAALDNAFAHAKQRIAALKRDPTDRVVVLFYFSGHSDGEALELGRDRLTFSQLRQWLATAGADVRVALVDSCKSGALLAAKGGAPGPAFQIRLTDDVASTGEALLTSSASDEVALESREIGGSFFTHHFISGLRGAADTSGDGSVTLNEAYQYAYAHTIKATGETVIGPQHPAYDYRLTGQGELVLTELTKPTAKLVLPPGYDRILVTDVARDEVIAEIGSDARDVLAIKPGRYALRAWRGDKIFAARVTVAAGEEHVVRADDLAPAGSIATISKGDLDSVDMVAPSSMSARAWRLRIAAGVTRGITDGIGMVPVGRTELELPSGLTAAIAAGSRGETSSGIEVHETQVFGLVGYRRGIARGRWRGWLGAEAGGGVVLQTGAHVRDAGSIAGELGANAGVAIAVGSGIALELSPSIAGELLRRNGVAAAVAVPSAWFGIDFALGAR